ncbi:MAG: SGNH/GDSL hydrolase family protein [Planctomycetota bacterium]|nr:SGNH/GDSL hydrolase family protein [Planctomycetota bacterium]
MSRTPTRRSILVAILLACVAPHWSCASKNTDASARAALADERPSLAAPALEKPAAPAPPPTEPPVRVLFIGNSYTFYNGGVDAVVQALARAKGRNLECTASTSGGKTLEWHWEEGDARSAIARGGWDYVVLQEYSTRPIADALAMHRYARLFDAEIKNAGAKTVFYMTWARFHQPENQRVITRAYDAIAKELNALVARVGPAWERVLEQRPDLKLHTDDRSHPTPAGTYLAACVFYATLTGDSPEGLPASVKTANGKTITLDPADARVLQRGAAAVSSLTAQQKPSSD